MNIKRRMLNIYSELPDGDEEMRAHVDALRTMVNSAEHRELFTHLYDSLTILDDKASALLTFNSIIIAVLAVVASNLGAEELLSLSILGGGIALLALSTFILLRIIWVHWSTTDDLLNLEGHIETLLNVRMKRTVWYRLAWLLVIPSIGLMLVFFVITAFERLYS